MLLILFQNVEKVVKWKEMCALGELLYLWLMGTYLSDLYVLLCVCMLLSLSSMCEKF